MKRKIIIISILVISFTIETILYFNPDFIDSIKNTENASGEEKSLTQVKAEIKTIVNTISKSGEIKSNTEETLNLHTSYYLSEVYVQENEYIAKGENILKYANGTYLTAPYNLVVTSLNLPEVGSIFTSKHSISVKGTDTLQTTLTVSEDDLDIVYVGQEAQIAIGALNNKVYKGYVTNISTTASYSSNGSKFTVTVEFENDGEILIGMTGRTEVILEKAENVVAVPIEAVETENRISYVTIVNADKTTEQVQVETGISNDAYIEIKSGIKEGDFLQIIENTSSNSNLRNTFTQGMTRNR